MWHFKCKFFRLKKEPEKEWMRAKCLILSLFFLSLSLSEKMVRPCSGAERIRKVKVVRFPVGGGQKIPRQALNIWFYLGNFYTVLNDYLFSGIQYNVVPRAAHCFTEWCTVIKNIKALLSLCFCFSYFHSSSQDSQLLKCIEIKKRKKVSCLIPFNRETLKCCLNLVQCLNNY